MRKKSSRMRGVFAGIVTVFMCYPILGFAIGFIYPDSPGRLEISAIGSSLFLVIAGNLLTFWLTYPLGAVFGGQIGIRYEKKRLQSKPMTEFELKPRMLRLCELLHSRLDST